MGHLGIFGIGASIKYSQKGKFKFKGKKKISERIKILNDAKLLEKATGVFSINQR